MLHSRRKRLKELDEREARGEVLWTEEFDERFRNKVLLAFKEFSRYSGKVITQARDAIMISEGLQFLKIRNAAGIEDLLSYLTSCDNEMVPTVIEAMYLGIFR